MSERLVENMKKIKGKQLSEENPLVTVAIAAYNVEKFLEKGIASVQKQTYKNLEILIVDDGSTDLTPLLCDKMAKEDSRIRVIHKENGGLGSARNMGIELAHGEFIYFFDVDDSMELNLIENNVKYMKSLNVDLVIFGYYARYNNSDIEEAICLSERYVKTNEESKKAYVEELLFLKHVNGFAWNKFYRKKFIDQYGFRFGNQRIQQDEPFNMQLYLKLKKVYICPKAYYHYVIYDKGNAGSRYLENKFDIITDVYHCFMKFYKTWDLNEKNVLDYIYNRYASGIYDVISTNLFHNDCKLGKAEKYKLMHQILNNYEVIRCIKKAWNKPTLDPVVFGIKHQMCLFLMIVIPMKKVVKRFLGK